MLPLQLSLTIVTQWKWMVLLKRSMSIPLPPSCQSLGLTLPSGLTQQTPTCLSARAGACLVLHHVCLVCPAAYGVVLSFARNLCVPRTGVRLDCPLGVAWPLVLSCPRSLHRSGAHRFSQRWKRWKVPRRRRVSQRWNWKFSLLGENCG